MAEKRDYAEENRSKLSPVRLSSGVPQLLIVTAIRSPLSRMVQMASQPEQPWRVRVLTLPADAATLHAAVSPELLLIELPITLQAAKDVLEHAKQHWPQTHLALFSSGAAVSGAAELTEAYGFIPHLVVPLPEVFADQVARELAEISFGSMRGLSLPSVLQLVQWDKKSMAILVEHGQTWGRLHLHQGQLVDAYVHHSGAQGEDAALDILSWEQGTLRMERSYHNQRRSINREVTHLLLEIGRRKDEQARNGSVAQALTSVHSEQHESSDTSPRGEMPEVDMFFKRKRTDEDQPDQQPDTVDIPGEIFRDSDDDVLSLILSDEEGNDMQNVKSTLDSALATIDGAMAIALVDYTSGMMLGSAGGGINLELAAAGNSEVVKAKLRTMDSLAIKGGIEDILITLDDQYHIIYLVPSQKLFMYLVLNKERSNLAMARYKLRSLMAEMTL